MGLPLSISSCAELSPFPKSADYELPLFVNFVLFVVKSLQSLLLPGDFLHQSVPAVERFFVLGEGAGFFRILAFPAVIFLGNAEE